MVKKSNQKSVEKVNHEHEHLIEVLKFTPRTYKVYVWGYGGEYVMGTVDRKIYDYFRNRRLDLSDFAWDSDYAEENNIPEDMWPFPPGSWYECDDMGHVHGVDRNAGTLQICDENGETVYERGLSEISGGDDNEPEWGGGDEIWINSKPAGTVVFIGVSSEKGTFFEGDIELREPFDITKLELGYDEIDGNEIINTLCYDGEEICNDGGSTDGKSSDFGFYLAHSGQDGNPFTRYKNMDDIDYDLTDWFPAKNNPVRPGKYNVETKDQYRYQALWNGSFWHNDWSQEKIKVVKWQGIKYDPDEQELRDELQRIYNEFPNMPSPDAIESLEQVHCTSCDWSGHEKECNDWDGQMCCPSCGEPVEFTN